MLGSINSLDIILPLVSFLAVYYCGKRGFLRTFVSILALFLAFTLAGLLYNPFLGGFGNLIGNSGRAQDSGAVIFAGFTLAFYLFFEWMVSRNYPDLRINALGNWNHILGAVIGVIWTALAISLVLLTIEYANFTLGASSTGQIVNLLGYLVDRSNFAALLRSFFVYPLAIVKLLFPGGLPDVLKYFAR